MKSPAPSSRLPIRTKSQIEAVVRQRARDAGLNANHIWRDVEKLTDSGRFILRLLNLPETPISLPRNRPVDLVRNASMQSAVTAYLLQADVCGTPISLTEARRWAARDFAVTESAVRHSKKRRPNAIADLWFEELEMPEDNSGQK